jgi:hypothetical protein
MKTEKPKTKKLIIRDEDLETTELPGNWGGVLTPSDDPDGHWEYEENDPPPGEETKVHAVVGLPGKGKGKGKPKAVTKPVPKPDEKVERARKDPEFVEAAKFAGLSVEDAVRLTRLFRP